MKRMMNVGLAVALVALVLLAAGCEGVMRLDGEDSGGSVTLSAGDTVEIVLASNPTTGYSWNAVEIPDCLTQEGEAEYDSDASPMMMGAGGEDTWRFVATEGGEGTLRLEYKKVWETGVEPADVFELEVTVE